MRAIVVVGAFLVCAWSVWVSDAAEVLVTLDLDAPIATVPSTYLSTTTDIATFVDHDHCDFKNETLRQMARALGCSHLRMGGTQGDFTFYNNFPGSSLNVSGPSELPAGFHRIFTWDQWREMASFAQAVGLKMYVGLNAGWGADGLVRAPLSSGGEWLPTMASWLMEDAVSGGFADTIEAFEFSNEPNLFPFGGNIANSTLAWALNGTRLAHDLHVVRAAMDQYQQRNGSNAWKLVCCDVAYVPLFGEIDPFVTEFAAAGGVDRIDQTTFHFYPLLGASYNKSLPPELDPFYASVGKVLDPWILDQVGYWADRFASDSGIVSNSTTPPGGVVLGETGSAVGGGQNGLSNRFADVIEYVDKIGQMTRRGQRKMFRQTLCGSPDQYYALISHNLTLHPSYFVTALLNYYVFGMPLGGGQGGGDGHDRSGVPKEATAPTAVRVWNATVMASDSQPPPTTTRVYAFSARGGVGPIGQQPLRNDSDALYVVVGIVNLVNTTDRVVLQLSAQEQPARYDGTAYVFAVNQTNHPAYRLDVTSGDTGETVDDVLGATTVRFNGVVMGWDAAAASITPPLGTVLNAVDAGSVVSSPVAATVTSVGLGWSFWWLPVTAKN